MNFGQAIDALKTGQRVERAGWNGKGMYIVLIGDCKMTSLDKKESAASSATIPPFIAMRTAQHTLVPWLASQTDVLAEDWQLA